MITMLFVIFGLISGLKYSLKNKFEKNKMVGTTIGFGGIGLIIGYFLSPLIGGFILFLVLALIIYIIYVLLSLKNKKEKTKETEIK